MAGNCKAGFKGDNCEDKDFCYEVECLNAGTCDQTNGKCKCQDGYLGETC